MRIEESFSSVLHKNICCGYSLGLKRNSLVNDFTLILKDSRKGGEVFFYLFFFLLSIKVR